MHLDLDYCWHFGVTALAAVGKVVKQLLHAGHSRLKIDLASMALHADPCQEQLCLQDALVNHGLLAVEQKTGFICNYRAADKDEWCRYFLESHPPPSRCSHVLGNVLERFDASVVAALTDLQAVFSADADTKKAASAGSSASERTLITSTLGRKFVQEAWKILAEVRPQTEAYCYSCQKRCCTHPSSLERSSRRYIHFAGSPCQAWSSLGKQSGWLHPNAISFLVWLRDVTYEEWAPDVIVHENTVRFDSDVLQLLCGATYEARDMEFAPTHLGLPCARMRKYTVMVKANSLQMVLGFRLSTLLPHVGRRMKGSGKMYWRAPKTLLQALNLHVGYEGKDFDENFGSELTAGDRTRLQRHVEVARENRPAQASASHVDLCINVRQNVSFVGEASRVVPALTTSAVIYGLFQSESGVKGRVLSGYEHFAVMGWPVLLPSSHVLAAYLPKALNFRQLCLHAGQSLTDTQLRALAGNGMHSASVGLLALLCVLGMLPVEVAGDNAGAPAKRQKLHHSV
eukprot:779384-Amphidinium_carterae.1